MAAHNFGCRKSGEEPERKDRVGAQPQDEAQVTLGRRIPQNVGPEAQPIFRSEFDSGLPQCCS